MGFKVCVSILGVFYSKIRNEDSNINSILLINKRVNKTVESDIGAVPMALYKSYTEQLGIIITSYIVYV